MSDTIKNGVLAKKLQELTKQLSLDRTLSAEIWKHFCQNYSSFLLEGDPIHWLGCVLYLKTTSSTLSKSPLNFTKLLRITNMSLIDFFQKTKRWAEHCSLPDENLIKFENLQRGFAVSMVAFKKFRPIFDDMFVESSSTEASRTYKKNKPNTKKLFEFTWALYICVKSSFPEVRDDLVHSYHLLLSACDYVFTNAFLSGRKDIINPKFPDCKNTTRFTQNCEVPCIIDILCDRHNGVKIEAKQVKEYSWKKQIKTLFDNKYLKGDPELLTEVLEQNNFEFNHKNIEKLYDDYIIGAGDFDERLYLANSFLNEIAGSGLQERLDDISFQLESKRKLFGLKSGINTPLTVKKYFKEQYYPKQVLSSSFNNIATLQVMLHGRTAEPSPALQKIIKNCGEITPSLETRVSDMAQMVFAHFTEATGDYLAWNEELALSRVDLSKKLYYRFLEKLLVREMSRSSFDCKVLINQDVFLKTLFACAVDLVIYTYRSPWIFPWVLETLHISAYHFSRIIEVVVRADELLSRDMVKHLNWIEELILENLAWKSDSPFWKAIIDLNLPVPSCEDVSVRPILKSEESTEESKKEDQQLPESGEKKDRLTALAGSKSILIDSPGASLSDKFQSPLLPGMKRSHEGTLNEPTKKVVILNNKIINTPAEPKDLNKEKEKPKRTGPIALFFRKFYYLSSVRLQDMCDQLGLSDESLRQKIWTSFELTVINHTNLMIDRHLDQILMCSIYVICKIVGPEQKFTSMMKCYRNQPQAQSKVYRNVLISPDRSIQDLLNVAASKRYAPEFGDIIQFYNKVFVNKVEDLVRRFKNGNVDANRIVLSPIPNNASVALQSPRRLVSDKHSIYVRCLSEKSPHLTPNSPHLSFCFSQSPAKDLRAINKCISQDTIKGKRLQILTDDDSENSKEFSTSASTDVTTSPVSAYDQKIKDLFNDRLADVVQKAISNTN